MKNNASDNDKSHAFGRSLTGRLNYFQDVQTVAGLPPSAEHKTKRRRNSDVSGDHRVPADSDLHRACSDEADV